MTTPADNDANKSNTNTGGGTFVGNDATAGRDFIGRDLIQIVINYLGNSQNKTVLISASIVAIASILGDVGVRPSTYGPSTYGLRRMDAKAKVHHLLLLVATLGLLSGCGKPNLPTKPAFHLVLTATVEIEGRAYPVDFTWSEENYVTWNTGAGWHTDWKSSHRTFVRILDTKFAVAVWLPSVADADLEQFHPTFALIERGNARFLRSYPTLKTGEKRDGVFQLTQLKIERSLTLFAAKPMTRDEQSLKADIAARRYGYLYGMLFHKEQWSRSQDLQRLLSVLKDVTPLGKPSDRGKEISEVWRAFSTFNAGTAMMEKMDRHLFGFEFRGDSWTPLPYPGVYWYRERLEEESAPVWISYRGHFIDQRQHELLFDETTQQLVIVWRYGLEPL